jgi:hypothetical protein
MLANESGQHLDEGITCTPVTDAGSFPRERRLPKIVSGGQSGVDRAALDVAIRFGLRHGGWCPAGRKAEDGQIPQRYELKETPSSEYRERTRRNVIDSDATLIICVGPLTGGTALTLREAKRLRKPHTVANLLRMGDETSRVIRWLKRQQPDVLNVAGPRASQHPGIGRLTQDFLERVLEGLA